MPKKDSEPDSVTHTKAIWIPILSEPDKTIIHKDGDTYTGLGWTREQADKNAGEKYQKGENDE